MNYLASPPLCVAYALAGTMDIDLYDEPLGEDDHGEPVFLKDIWPSAAEVAADRGGGGPVGHVPQELRRGVRRRRALELAGGAERRARSPGIRSSTYVRRPPFFDDAARGARSRCSDIEGARVLAVLGDSVTTDHISPAGSIKRDSPAGQVPDRARRAAQGLQLVWLAARQPRGDDARARSPTSGCATSWRRGPRAASRCILAARTPTSRCRSTTPRCATVEEGIPLVVLAGKEYGSGSSRDWAAKGTRLLGVRAVIAESFERIHRSNLVGMGVLPLQFQARRISRVAGAHRHGRRSASPGWRVLRRSRAR